MSDATLEASAIQSDNGGKPRLLGYRLKVSGQKYFEVMLMGSVARVGILLPCCGRGTSNALRCPRCSDLPLLRAAYDIEHLEAVMGEILDGFGWDPLSSELAWSPWRGMVRRAVEYTRAGNSKWRGGEYLPPESVLYHMPPG